MFFAKFTFLPTFTPVGSRNARRIQFGVLSSANGHCARELRRQVEKRLQKRARAQNYATGVNPIALFSKVQDVSSRKVASEKEISLPRSTHFLVAPRRAVSCSFSLPPVDKRCLFRGVRHGHL